MLSLVELVAISLLTHLNPFLELRKECQVSCSMKQGLATDQQYDSMLIKTLSKQKNINLVKRPLTSHTENH
jgi:hypothetical protein